MKNIIFYFTGTGNSLKVAKDISANIQNSELLSMAANLERVSVLKPQGFVGFVFPVYYCGLPQIVHEFISAINLADASYVWIACVYGKEGGKAGCIQETTKILKKKDVVLSSAFYVKTVDNFILWTWDVPPIKKRPLIHEKAGEKSEQIAKIVSAGEKHFDCSITEYIAPIVFRHKYFIKTVNSHDKCFRASSNCNGCGLCADVCPTNNIHMDSNFPTWKSKTCQRCLACLHLCPSACIQYGNVTVKRQRYKNPYVTVDEIINSGQR